MEENFNEGNIVWIKLKGYPWWPGIVRIKIIKYITPIFYYIYR